MAKVVMLYNIGFCLLWGCSSGTDPVTDSTTLRSVAKVVELGTKTTKNNKKVWVSYIFPTEHRPYQLVLINILLNISLGYLVFIEFNILICILMEIQRRTHLNPAPSPAIQPPAQPQPQPAPKRRRKPQNFWVMLWIRQNQEKGCYSNLLEDL